MLHAAAPGVLNLLQSGFCCCFLKQMVLLVESKLNWNWNCSARGAESSSVWLLLLLSKADGLIG